MNQTSNKTEGVKVFSDARLLNAIVWMFALVCVRVLLEGGTRINGEFIKYL